jgi:predicted transcriptional regulator
MSTQSVKDQILKAIQDLPDDATVESAMERLYLLYKIEQGIEQADRGQVVSQEEVKHRMEQWLK